MGEGGIDTSQLLTPFDTEGYNSTLYAFTVRTLRAHCSMCYVRIALCVLLAA